VGHYKCNVDASFIHVLNKVGIGMRIRDDEGHFVLAKSVWLPPLLDFDLGEALCLLPALQWIHDLQLDNVDFEMTIRCW